MKVGQLASHINIKVFNMARVSFIVCLHDQKVEPDAAAICDETDPLQLQYVLQVEGLVYILGCSGSMGRSHLVDNYSHNYQIIMCSCPSVQTGKIE